jgi:Predicted membrane protein
MERKLYRGIMNPAMIATYVFGAWMLYLTPGWLSQGWLHAKLTLVIPADRLPSHLWRPAQTLRRWHQQP